MKDKAMHHVTKGSEGKERKGKERKGTEQWVGTIPNLTIDMGLTE